MKRRVMIAGVAAVASLLVPLAAAAPASAGTGVGCISSNCSVSVWQFVKHSGAWGASGNSVVPIDVPPPPCLWNPIGNATTGSQYILGEFGTGTPTTQFDVDKSVALAKKLEANPKPGEWYVLPVNPNAGPAGEKECMQLPLFAWVPPGQTPPMPNVPPQDLAEYAYNHMIIPSPVLTVTPAKAWVNLASYAHLTTPGKVTVSATLGNETVWVTARPVKTTIASSSAGTPYSSCGLKGSRYRAGKNPKAGAGVPPDCGVLWQAPTTDGTVTATVTWQVTWGPGGGALPPVTLNDTVGGLRVAEIQSINGNGGNN